MATHINHNETQTKHNKKEPRLIAFLKRFVLSQVWFVHQPVILMVNAQPPICLQTLTTAAKPSTQRLHLRNLFAQGRRYHIQPKGDGFKLTTTRHIVWRYRRRTSSTAVMRGTFTKFDENITQIALDVRMNVGYLIDVFLIPIFMTSFLIYTPWNPTVIVGSLLALYFLSWFGHRNNAALEAHDMVWFVQKALDDLVPAEVLMLEPQNKEIMDYNQDFGEAWQKFYEDHKGDTQ